METFVMRVTGLSATDRPPVMLFSASSSLTSPGGLPVQIGRGAGRSAKGTKAKNEAISDWVIKMLSPQLMGPGRRRTSRAVAIDHALAERLMVPRCSAQAEC